MEMEPRPPASPDTWRYVNAWNAAAVFVGMLAVLHLLRALDVETGPLVGAAVAGCVTYTVQFVAALRRRRRKQA